MSMQRASKQQGPALYRCTAEQTLSWAWPPLTQSVNLQTQLHSHRRLGIALRPRLISLRPKLLAPAPRMDPDAPGGTHRVHVPHLPPRRAACCCAGSPDAGCSLTKPQPMAAHCWTPPAAAGAAPIAEHPSAYCATPRRPPLPAPQHRGGRASAATVHSAHLAWVGRAVGRQRLRCAAAWEASRQESRDGCFAQQVVACLGEETQLRTACKMGAQHTRSRHNTRPHLKVACSACLVDVPGTSSVPLRAA